MFECSTPPATRSRRAAQPSSDSTDPSAHLVEALQSELTQCLVKINHCNALLSPIPHSERCSFTLLLCTQQRSQAEQQQRSEGEACWLPVDVAAPALSANTNSSAAQLPLIVPLRSIRTSLLDVEVYVEESADKRDRADSDQVNVLHSSA